MAERIVLNEPEQITEWRLYRLELDSKTPSVGLWFENDVGHMRQVSYTGPEATAILRNVNKRNFSGANPSLYYAAMQKVVADGHFTGTISGSEDPNE